MVNPDLREKCPICGKFQATRTGGGGCLDLGACEAPKELGEHIEEEDEVILEEEEAEEEVVEEEESLDDEDLEAYFEELPVKELKKLCKEADLSTKGKKADLVARLLE